MTRLNEQLINKLESNIKSYDLQLQRKTGADLVAISAHAAGIPQDVFRKSLTSITAAVIPVTAGKGIIGGFAGSVAAILREMGINSYVTAMTDVSGFYEATEKRADIIFMADDKNYIAYRCDTGKIAHNNKATILGFVTALERRIGQFDGKRIVSLGYGTIGAGAAAIMKVRGANIRVFDIDPDRRAQVEADGFQLVDSDLIDELEYADGVFDATNEGEWLDMDMLPNHVIISAPGVPLSLTSAALALYGDNIIHDPLQIGTGTMVALLYDGGKRDF